MIWRILVEFELRVLWWFRGWLGCYLVLVVLAHSPVLSNGQLHKIYRN